MTEATRSAQRRWPRLPVAVAIVLPMAFVFVVALLLRDSTTTRTGIEIADYSAPAVAEDRPAPGFTMPTLSGGRVSLAGSTGHPVVLSFWASWCPPCRQEAPYLKEAWSRYRSKGVRFLGVDHRDGRSDAMAFRSRLGLAFPSVYDPDGTLASRYALYGLPTTVVIGSDGRIAYRITGRVDATNLSRALTRLTGPVQSRG
jgi:peroxiredoxin